MGALQVKVLEATGEDLAPRRRFHHLDPRPRSPGYLMVMASPG